MKKTSLLLALVFFAQWNYAQEHDTREEFSTESNNFGISNQSNLQVGFNNIFSKNHKSGWKGGHWAGVNLYFNGLIENLGNLSLPEDAKYMTLGAKSVGIAINPFDITLIRSERVGLITGLGLELNNFRFDKNLTIKRENGRIVPDTYYEDNNVELTKSKLFTAYLNVPLLVEFQIGKQRYFYINTGMVGGWNIGSRTKVKAKAPPILNGKSKNSGNLGIRNFHYGYTINIGYEHIALSATYYRSTIFRPDEGPRIQQINLGLSFMF